MILEGRAGAEAAELNGMDRQTLRDWVHRYDAFGAEGLKSRRSPGAGVDAVAEGGVARPGDHRP
jgi:hypothetical protein